MCTFVCFFFYVFESQSLPEQCLKSWNRKCNAIAAITVVVIINITTMLIIVLASVYFL